MTTGTKAQPATGRTRRRPLLGWLAADIVSVTGTRV